MLKVANLYNISISIHRNFINDLMSGKLQKNA